MAIDWHKCRLGDLAEIYDGPHATPAKADSGPIFLGISNLVNGRIDLSNREHLSEEDFRRWTRRVTPQAGDVVFSYETRLGEAALVPAGLRCCLGRRMGLLRARPGQVDSRFLLYAYLGPAFQQTLRSRTVHGSTVDRIPLIDMPEFPICIPASIEQQREIAHILGTLDDKIELNRRMNDTLEAMARAIFKSWFVDFDPIRAKADGRQPFGMDAETIALFPDSFEDSPVGKIPKGWNVGPILVLADLLSGGTPKTSRREFWNGDILWASAKDVSQCRDTFLVQTERNITQRGLAESATQLIPRFSTVVVARGATTGRMALLGREMAMNQTCYALASKTNTPFSLYCMLRNEVEKLVHAAHGSVFDTVTTSTFQSSEVMLPAQPVLDAFEVRIAPVFQFLLTNTKQASDLAAVRDLLLPKMISGEIRFQGFEKCTDEALS